jgi:talin
LGHGLLLKDQGIWLASNKMIGHYEFKFGDVLEFKKKHRVLKVKTLDNTFKTILIDESLSVKDLVDLICERIGLSNSEEYSLQKEEVETKSQTKDKKLKKIEGMSTDSSNITTYIEGWLNPDKTLREQGLSDDEPVILKKKFFFTDQNVDRSDPVQMGLIYSQSHQMIISGKLPVTAEEAGQFGGIGMQILYGNQDPEKHKLGFAK